MAAITLATLKKGAESLGVEFEPKISKKDLEDLIKETLSKQELGYECPNCKRDIPDVDTCPFCAESFVDEGEPDEEESKLEITNEDNILTTTPDSTDVENKGKDIEIKTGITKEQGKTGDSKDKAKNSGKADKVKEAPKSGKDSEEYKQLIASINEAYPDLIAKVNASGLTYLVGKKRLMKVTGSTKSISIEFNEALETDDDNVRKYTEEEAKAKHLGTVRAIYGFGDLDTALSLVKQAYELRTAKEPVETK